MGSLVGTVDGKGTGSLVGSRNTETIPEVETAADPTLDDIDGST